MCLMREEVTDGKRKAGKKWWVCVFVCVGVGVEITHTRSLSEHFYFLYRVQSWTYKMPFRLQ